MAEISIPTGVFDIIPQDNKEAWRSSYLWNFVEKAIYDHVRVYGCKEIRTPIFERTELFQRSVGDDTDIVSKEMYTFEDKGGRSMTLRPEMTASCMRAFIEKQMHNQANIHRLFYLGPMFRYERPQAGRFRQFHQFGVEFIGSSLPQQDAEVIEMGYSLFERLGISQLTVYISSLGSKETRSKFQHALKEYLRPHCKNLSEESQKRFETNPLRILDSKNEQDRKIVEQAPTILQFLSEEDEQHFGQVRKILDQLRIPYEVSTTLVRGLDYYNKTVFEITSGKLGAQNTILGGGRYDGLLKELGGPNLPTIGFAVGMERLIQTLLCNEITLPKELGPELYIIPLGDESLLFAFELVKKMRQDGTVCLVDMSSKKLKVAMQMASELGVEYVLVLGENELKEKICDLKAMATGEKLRIPLTMVADYFRFRHMTRNFCSFSKNIAGLLTSAVAEDKETLDCYPLVHDIQRISDSAETLSEVLSKCIRLQ